MRRLRKVKFLLKKITFYQTVVTDLHSLLSVPERITPSFGLAGICRTYDAAEPTSRLMQSLCKPDLPLAYHNTKPYFCAQLGRYLAQSFFSYR